MKTVCVSAFFAVLFCTAACYAAKAGDSIKFAVCCELSQYPEVQAAGYDFIETGVNSFLSPAKSDSVFMSHLSEMRRLGAKIISCTVFLPGDYKIVGKNPDTEKIIEWAKTVFKRAGQADIPFIVFGSGGSRKVPAGFSKKKATRQFVALCKQLGPLAAKEGVTIVIEPLNTLETNLINTLREGAETVEAVNHPNVQLLCDIFHSMRENVPPSDIVKYGKYIKHCHIAEKEIRSAPGTKGDDFGEWFAALKQANYAGCISVECIWDDFSSRLGPALRYMKGVRNCDGVKNP
ncbi:MAG: sugar phosphate isomerase/epimerase [Dysgonamonadaceae bacterium]|jgi:sugar phosphate isomerase/epimerase|nr:sugar phosphate isomerase/epimerase [Dysgonamonadaceae bacterium]